MWKILNKLFGWDYILWENSFDNGVARINTDADGQVFYWRYSATYVADKITAPDDVKLWLTCKPSKYLKEKPYD